MSAATSSGTAVPPADEALADVARDALFAPIGGEGLVQQTVRRLGEAIGLGVLREGDRLPPESELAARFEISAMTLRQALAILRETGCIETRRGHGGGTVVTRSTPLPPSAEALARAKGVTAESVRDLTDFRAATSGHAAALAAERATPEEIAALRELVAAMRRAPFERFRQLDSRFHIGIASAARSVRLVTAETDVQRDLLPMLALAGDAPPRLSLKASNEQHAAILDAIELRDPVAARGAMETHVGGTLELLIGLRLGKVR